MSEAEDASSYVFLDANILLHYVPPQQIDWPRMTACTRVHLVIYPLLLTELTKAKDLHYIKGIRRRAADREAWLRPALADLSTPVRPGVYFHRDAHEPRGLLRELGLVVTTMPKVPI